MGNQLDDGFRSGIVALWSRGLLVAAVASVCALVCAVPLAGRGQGALRDGSHDFDFEFGAWKAHLSRQLHPLTSDKTWVDYDGTSVVRKIWGGRANIGELAVSGPAGSIEGATLRFYDPQAHQWNVSWVNAATGEMTPPLVGGFKDGRGEFYDEDTLDGRSIYARFIFSDFTPSSFRIVQSFSDDGGKTWEANWIATFTKATVAADGLRTAGRVSFAHDRINASNLDRRVGRDGGPGIGGL